jgi:uncharacterized protein YjiS (DUF1127 family)
MERAMSTMNLNQRGVWNQLKQSFLKWSERANSRIEQNNLNDRTLRDIGLSPGNERKF